MHTLISRRATLLSLLLLLAACDNPMPEKLSDSELCVEARMSAYAANVAQNEAESQAQTAAQSLALAREAIRSEYMQEDMNSTAFDEFATGETISADEYLGTTTADHDPIPAEIWDKVSPAQLAEFKKSQARADEAQKKLEEATSAANKAAAKASAWLACIR